MKHKTQIPEKITKSKSQILEKKISGCADKEQKTETNFPILEV